MLNEMKYVYAVYRERSFSKAAQKLFVSQPALSNMIKKAEAEIGMPIFDRSTIPLTVTKEGAYYIREIEEIMLRQRNLMAYFKDLQTQGVGSLSLGGSSFFCSYLFPDLIGRFREKHPNVSIDLLEGNVRELKKGLEDETLDLVVETALDGESASIERVVFKYEQIILAVPALYPVNRRLQPYRLSRKDILNGRYLQAQVEPAPLEEFRSTPFIIMKAGNDMYQRSISMCRNAGFQMRVAMQVDQVLTSINIASNGVGAVFVRSDIVRYMPDSGMLVYYKLGDPLAQRPVVFAVKRGRYVTSVMIDFMRLAGLKWPERVTEE